ncbi:uncharacterized protein [Antedon mediterranea]|uniref:uncharacterized protein n=1 Tax=Antedon mediterranea TaxID=105859 RepID=UPI003AF84A7E
MEKYQEEAEEWIKLKDASFTLSKVNEDVRELTFELEPTLQSDSKVTFKITCSNSENQEEFSVSSEDEATNLHFFEVNDALENKKNKTLSQILNMIQIIFSNKHDLDTETEDDESDDEEEEEDDDYYTLKEENDSNIADDIDDDSSLNMKYSRNMPNSAAVSRLMIDLKQLKKSSRENNFGIKGGPRGDNLFLWDVLLTDFDSTSRLGSDIMRYAKKYNEEPGIKIEMTFPPGYPMEPPFLRVVKPRFKFLTGHVTIGGSICMELLTRSGWSPTNDIESILVQVRAEIMSDSNARLDSNPNTEYSEKEAQNAFKRMTQKYGWDK